mgnify:CR=1 FL=1
MMSGVAFDLDDLTMVLHPMTTVKQCPSVKKAAV